MDRTDSDPGGSPEARDRDKRTVADRFAETDLAEDRFINVLDGEKGTHDHDTRYSDPREVPGTNYGIYPDSGLVDIDIDDYGDATDDAGQAGVLDLPDTLTAASPHTDGYPGGHRYYHVTGDVADALESAFGTANPQPSWGEVRAVNQYVVGPGSQLDGCDKAWCDKCATPTGGRYRVATNEPIATISAETLVEALEADPKLGADEHASTRTSTATAATAEPAATEYDAAGTDVESFIDREKIVDTYLAAGAKAAGFTSASGGDDRSRADYYVCSAAIEHGVAETDIRQRLAECPHSKVGTDDAAANYWRRTWSKALAEVDEPNQAASDVAEVFRRACDEWELDYTAVGKVNRDGETHVVGIGSILEGCEDLGEAVLRFDRNADLLSGKDRQAVVGYVVFVDLSRRGEFFQTTDGRLYYFHEPETHVYRVDDPGRRVLTEEFQSFAWGRYNLLAGTFSRNLGKDVKNLALRDADERAVYKFAHYDPDAGELYVNDFGDGYYAVSPDGVEWRANGTDLFFLPTDRAESFEYLPTDDRPDLPDEIPGEREMWAGSGDPLMRLFGNRINYSEDHALGPAQQRKQLYLHLHTLPFVDVLNARPIMAWVGEKGSGKTVIQRAIGRFVFGDGFTESVMPDSKEDFLAKVSNQALAFVDNYDDGNSWANDVLAAVATGAGINLREYYTTNDLHQAVPRCWLSVTSRDPPFRRDDVADRTLVFRVERVEDGFVGMGDYLRQITAYRDVLWSAYLDNLRALVAEYAQRDTGAMSSDHRMADWAIFARIVADALGVGGVDDLLETMETDRATFALENEPWARVLGRWIRDDPETAGQYNSAGDIADALEATADDSGLNINVTSARGIGSKFNHYREELGELYGLEIDDSGHANQYRFNAAGDDETGAVGLGRFRS
jgi:hypothetical protein